MESPYVGAESAKSEDEGSDGKCSVHVLLSVFAEGGFFVDSCRKNRRKKARVGWFCVRVGSLLPWATVFASSEKYRPGRSLSE